jgi:cobaltochelatase CobN
MVNITLISWGSEISLLKKAAERIDFNLTSWNVYELKANDSKVRACIESFADSDLVLIHPSHDSYWDDIIEGFPKGLPVISYGFSDLFWSASTVPLSVVSAVSTYFLYGGLENLYNMLAFCAGKVLGMDLHYDEPTVTRWEGIYHPDIPFIFDSSEEYFLYMGRTHDYNVGIIFLRSQWICGDLRSVDTLIREFEKFSNVTAVFCFSSSDDDLGALSEEACIRKYMPEKLDALIDLRSFIQSRDRDALINCYKELNTPVFHPLTFYHDSEEEWENSKLGMSGSEAAWTVALPEFSGMTEMIPVSFAEKDAESGAETNLRLPSEERIVRFSKRIFRWMRLSKKSKAERKIAIILHNKPCASSEGTVGSGANLDTLESVSNVLRALKREGYNVRAPESGEDLITEIMSKKAVSEFRWTSVDEIVKKGGALALIAPDDYMQFFSALPEKVRSDMIKTWGNPPGEEIDGVPPAMVYNGKIVVSGLNFENAIVCVQPKRGCAGSRCDGRACKLLHDPEIPPTHQYLATYNYIGETFDADVIIHVGTHGNLEFLPGKSIGLSGSCYPDIAIGNIPHLYIYNSDNPPEGTTAKRRACATIVNHMQTVMANSELYGSLKELEDQISEYRRAAVTDKARAHALTHTIEDLLEETGIGLSINLRGLKYMEASFDEIIEAAHKVVSETYETKIPDGMHIFGHLPEGDRRTEMIYSILEYEGELLEFIYKAKAEAGAPGNDNPASAVDPEIKKESEGIVKSFISYTISREIPEIISRNLFGAALSPGLEPEFRLLYEKINDINQRIEDTDEIGSLLNGISGGFIEPGPSGLVTRGNPEILPTGRNMYSLDPYRVPTKAAWRIGSRLAEEVINRYINDNGKYPENIAFYWVSIDVMWGDGEVFSQILKLIGAEPVWKSGKVVSFRIIPYDELNRPRIDVTIKISGIMRDNFYNCIEFMDDAVKAILNLDEPDEINFLRKHGRENPSTSRIFGNRPGTYGNGVNLAVYSSAWKEEADLADIFLEWNSYSYGRDNFGTPAGEDMVLSLKSVDMTFNVAMTDEYDLLGCCCYFGNHGGLTIAARSVSHKDVPVYYGDTRHRDEIEVRTIADEIRRVVRTKLLNPKWIDGMKRHGYKGAGDISKRVTHVYGWEATTGEVDDSIFDNIAETFVLDEKNRNFFSEKNPWALEEISRRLLEAEARNLWNADPDILEKLKETYLDIEGDIEDRMDDSGGNIQGGSIDVYTLNELNMHRKK